MPQESVTPLIIAAAKKMEPSVTVGESIQTSTEPAAQSFKAILLNASHVAQVVAPNVETSYLKFVDSEFDPLAPFGVL